jgi:two-component system sensor histidine kinase CreC
MSLTSRLLLGFALIAGIGFWLMMDQVLQRVERQYLEAEEEPWLISRTSLPSYWRAM